MVLKVSKRMTHLLFSSLTISITMQLNFIAMNDSTQAELQQHN